VRTTHRFEVPLSSGPEDFVKVRIALDHSGSIVRLELIDSTHPQFTENAMKALKSASPFPPLNDNNRCLTDKSFLMTFNYPE
jgi:TonB family protein